MTVEQLIEQLKQCPKDMIVRGYYDSAPRMAINGIFISNPCDDWTLVPSCVVLCNSAEVNQADCKEWIYDASLDAME